MPIETHIMPSLIAQHWGVSKARVSQLMNRPENPMPKFKTLEEADTWRALNLRLRSSLNRANQPEKNRVQTQPQQPANNNAPSASATIVDIKPFLDRPGDYETNMVRDAEQMPYIARGLFDRACGNLNIGEIMATLKIWSEAADKASAARAAFLALQERKRNLISLDEVMDIVGTEFQAIRSVLLKLGARVGPRANPADPKLAETAINDAVDDLLRTHTAGIELAHRELVEGKSTSAPELPELPAPADPSTTDTPAIAS